MDNDVESHELPEVLAVESELVGIIGTIIEASISSWNLGVVSVAIVENNGGNS